MPDSGYDFDFIVIGSGFGGSVAALRLAEKGYRVAVMEMGRRWPPENLPRTNWLVWRWIWRPRLALRGFFNIKLFRHVLILHGCAVGGGSITYANTLLVPKDSVWENGSWAGLAHWKNRDAAPLRDGPTDARCHRESHTRSGGPHPQARGRCRRCGPHLLSHSSWRLPGQRGRTRRPAHPDPYFGGEGPERATCIGCGGCMVGCRYNAKNSLDKNYLYLAEKHGARVFAETRVVGVRPWMAARTEAKDTRYAPSSPPAGSAKTSAASPAGASFSLGLRSARWISCFA